MPGQKLETAPGTVDSTLAMATLAALMCFAYIGSISMGLPTLFVFWPALLAFVLCFVDTRVVLACLVMHALFAGILGLSVASNAYGDAEYFRVILTSFISCCAQIGVLFGFSRRPPSWASSPAFHIILHRFGMMMLVVWAVAGMMAVSNVQYADIRDFTGSSYLTLSDLISLFGLCVVARRDISLVEFILVIAITCFACVIAGSRTSMVLVAVLAILLLLRKLSLVSLWAMAVAALPVLWYFDPLSITLSSPAFNRMATLSNMAGDRSLSARLYFLDNLADRLNTSPLCFIFPCPPASGAYAHNILSLIEYFGILGFFLLFVILFITMLRAKIIWRSEYFGVFVYVIASFAFSRAWVSILFPTLLALTVYFAMDIRRRHSVATQASIRSHTK